MLIRIVAALTLITSFIVFAAETPVRRRSVRTPAAWSPQCESVNGFPAVSLSTNGGVTVLPHTEAAEFLQINTFGLAAVRDAQHLLAVAGRVLLASNDGGCTWTFDDRIQFPDHGYRLVPAGEQGTLAWTIYRPELYLLRDDAVVQHTAPTPLPLNISVDATSPNRLAAGDDQGSIWWSDDAGATWTPQQKSPSRAPLYALEFSSRGRTHAITSGLADGAQVTFDGGATWQASRGVEGLNVFRIAFSPIDPNIVWAVTLNPTIKGAERRAIHHSNDGGRTFTKILIASADVPMKNGFTLAPSPANASLLYFALPGTTLYLIDDEGAIRQRSTFEKRDFDSIVFSPSSTRVMYFGLKISDMSAE